MDSGWGRGGGHRDDGGGGAAVPLFWWKYERQLRSRDAATMHRNRRMRIIGDGSPAVISSSRHSMADCPTCPFPCSTWASISDSALREVCAKSWCGRIHSDLRRR
eukprot:490140-Rhodomonas_salina.1